MLPLHHSYSIEIKKLKFISEEGQRYPSTALIHFQVDGREKPIIELMGYLTEEEIFGAIDRGEQVNLDHCYLDRFSLADYRISRNLDSREKVELKDFSARGALFGGLVALDFSHAVFTGNEFSLEDAWISRGDVTFESARFDTGRVSFHNTRLPVGHFNFKNVVVERAQVIFRNCIFGAGEKDFQYASFGTGGLFFTNAEFSDGNVNFVNTDFGSGDASFKVARFGTGKVDFHFARFCNEKVSFERTEFGNGRVDFRTVEFATGRVNFNRAIFGIGEVNFDECEMVPGKFSMKRVQFGTGDVSFEQVMFEHVDASFERTAFGSGKVSFYQSWFHTLGLAFCQLDGYVDLRVNSCRYLDLSNSIVRDIIDLNPHDFKARVEEISLAGMRLIGRIYLDWKRNEVRRMVYACRGAGSRIRAEQFRILKENFKNLGHYNDEDRAYVEFKRNESKAELQESVERKPLNALYQYPRYWFKLILFDRAGLYATSPFRVLVTMLIFLVLFSFLYDILMLFTPADIIAAVDDQLSLIPRSFYHSAITFLTIGYGDHYPYGAIRWVSALEGFTGLFLMSYFTVAFVRKILR